ncbi:Sensor histidine kinase RcsC [Stutzerimonas stutzeri]
MRILVVEDEIKAAEYLQQGLIECGYLVHCVSDGLDGFHLALQNDYDIVLLDVNLPTMDGWRFSNSSGGVSRHASSC